MACKRRNEGAGLRLGGVDGAAVVGAVLGEAERLAQAGHALLAAEHLAGAQHGQHQVEFGLARRALRRGRAGRRGSGRP